MASAFLIDVFTELNAFRVAIFWGRFGWGHRFGLGHSINTPQGEGWVPVRSVQRSWRVAPRLPGSASSRRASGELTTPRKKREATFRQRPTTPPAFPSSAPGAGRTPGPVPTPRPAAAMMTCIGGCGGRRMLGRWRCRRRSNIHAAPPPCRSNSAPGRAAGK